MGEGWGRGGDGGGEQGRGGKGEGGRGEVILWSLELKIVQNSGLGVDLTPPQPDTSVFFKVIKNPIFFHLNTKLLHGLLFKGPFFLFTHYDIKNINFYVWGSI